MSKKLTIIDYGSGNLHSIHKACQAVAGNDINVVVSNQFNDIEEADYVILPGVGAYGDCMDGLKRTDGLIVALTNFVIINQRPFLGVCVGMQLLSEHGEESNGQDGFGWIGGEVVAIEPKNPTLKIPHMGWNTLEFVKEHPILDGIHNGDHAYFVHSYYFKCKNENDIIAKTDYGMDITAIIAKDNIVATQFHPEKSQATGLKLLENFLKGKLL